MKCSKCGNEMVLRKTATKAVTTVGAFAGGVSGYLAATATTTGIISLAPLGPLGVLLSASSGGIARGILGALGGGSAGAYAGSKLGEVVDEKIIAKYVCKNCGHEECD